MNEENKPPKQWISFRVKPEEYRQIHRHFEASTCRKLSDYTRKVLLQKPVLVRYRNQSAQDFLTEMVELKKELNALGNNFNQGVKKLNSSSTDVEIKLWLVIYKNTQEALLKKAEEIKVKMNQIYELWLQK